MTSIVIFIDGWLEFPEYALPLAFLLGFALSRTEHGPGPEAASPAEVRELRSPVGPPGR
jgi:hypothetical protein